MNMDMGAVDPQLAMPGSTLRKLPWEPTRLSHLKPVLRPQDINLAVRQDLWHKFIVYGIENIDKVDILDAIISVDDEMIPMMYRVEHPNKGTFIAECIVPGLERLVKQGLRVSTASGHVLAIDIILGFLNVHEIPSSPQRAISQALQWRYEGHKKLLDLSNFHNDKALSSIYCPLSSPKKFGFVIKCCRLRILKTTRDSKLWIRELNLQSNSMTAHSFLNFGKSFTFQLTKLDLRYNKIEDIDYLRCFPDFKITELWLDGNPLCAKYTSPEEYIRRVKSVFPHVQRLDGVMIGVDQKYMPIRQPCFIGNASRVNLVKQFIKHFFAFYDQDDRIVLNGLYDPEAFFSTTLGLITNHNHSQMTKAFANNRNLLRFVDYAKCHEFVLRGPEKIIAALRRQPPTYHNFKNFNVDIMYQGDESVVIAIQGFFCYKEFPTKPLFFNRTFVLVEADDNEYCIINDQYHIQSEMPGTKAAEYAWKPVEQSVTPKIEPTIFSPSERHQLLTFLRDCTTMNEEYCRRYLDDADWDIRAALTKFTKAYTVNNVPPEAFKKLAIS